MQTRRTFLHTTTGAAALSLSHPLLALPANHRFMQRIGLQLWTVRDQLKEHPKETLQAIKAAGYQQVELMQVKTAHEIAPIARDIGLDVTSSFMDWQALGNPTGADARSFEVILEEAHAANLKYLVHGWLGRRSRKTEDQFKAFADRANAAGEKCAPAGIQLCYHNHSFEFKPFDNHPHCGYDVLIERLDPKSVPFEVDIFWVQLGGWDPAATLRRLGKRVCQVHLKDKRHGCPTIYDEMQVSPLAYKELGQGRIDIAACIKAADEMGVAQCHVEQDHSPDPIKSIGVSMEYLRR